MLRLRNIHPDLNGMDLSKLLSTVAPVDFVKFDPRNETMAYVCFQQNAANNNKIAIQKFDGKKAMGNTLVVENATSLADRIAPTQNQRPRQAREFSKLQPVARPAREQQRVKARTKAKVERAKKVRPVQKTAEDLDNELSAYMNAGSETAVESAPAPSQDAPFAAQSNGEVMMD